jgi:hypothetical protein
MQSSKSSWSRHFRASKTGRHSWQGSVSAYCPGEVVVHWPQWLLARRHNNSLPREGCMWLKISTQILPYRHVWATQTRLVSPQRCSCQCVRPAVAPWVEALRVATSPHGHRVHAPDRALSAGSRAAAWLSQRPFLGEKQPWEGRHSLVCCNRLFSQLQIRGLWGSLPGHSASRRGVLWYLPAWAHSQREGGTVVLACLGTHSSGRWYCGTGLLGHTASGRVVLW